MKKTKKMLLIVLAVYVIVLGINIAGNWSYYAAGNDWRFSIFFTLCITTIGNLGAAAIYYLFFRKVQWTTKPTRNLLLSVAIFALYGYLLMAGSLKVMVWFFHFPDQAGSDYLNSSIMSIMISMIIGLMVTGQQFLLHLKKSIEDNEQMKREMVQSQYETLKSQVNPHFLFNALNTLTVMIPSNPDMAVSFVEQLSKVFRYSLQYSGENTIDLGTELKVVQSYLFLNGQRYGPKLQSEIKLDEAVLEKKIITQSLLMLMENAIKHNELSNDKPLTIKLYAEGDYLVVQNTLQRKSIPEASTNTGLENIKKRYTLAFTLPVTIEETNNLFTVKIPLL